MNFDLSPHDPSCAIALAISLHAKLSMSSVIAESAVNEVVSLRMAKKRQRRWTDEVAHLLTQVRVHERKGELRPTVKPPANVAWDGDQMPVAA
jgi:hypothetical protein